MTIFPKIRVRYGENVGVEIFVSPPNLSGNPSTFLSADAASGASSFTVDAGTKFAANDYLLVGAFGGAKSEIVTSGTPSTTSVPLGSNAAFAHNRGEQLTFIPYNQVIIERSTDSGQSYSTLTTIDIQANSPETYYEDTAGSSTYYYRAKFSNSTTADTSQTSDAVIATGYVANTAGQVIHEALISAGERIDNVITKEFLFSALHEGRAELDNMPGVERWSYRTSFDYDAGDVIPGQNELTLPSTLRESSTNKNILAVRVGRDRLPLDYVDKEALDRWYEGVAKSTLNGAITSASTEIVLTSSGDFDESGDISIAGAAVSDTVDVVAYTSNTESTNTLGGVDGIQAAGHSSGAVVWQGASFGYPLEYTVFEGKIVFSQPFDDEYAGENIFLDFYTELTRADSDGDTLDEPHFEMFIPYLRWRIRKRRDPDLKADDSDDYKSWTEKRDAAVAKEYLGQDVRLVVDVPV